MNAERLEMIQTWYNMKREGISVAEIAKEYGYNENYIQQMINIVKKNRYNKLVASMKSKGAVFG